jgi:hypothetical protein
MKRSLKQSRRTIAPRRPCVASERLASHEAPEMGATPASTMEALLADLFAFSALVDHAVASVIAKLRSALSSPFASARNSRQA